MLLALAARLLCPLRKRNEVSEVWLPAPLDPLRLIFFDGSCFVECLPERAAQVKGEEVEKGAFSSERFSLLLGQVVVVLGVPGVASQPPEDVGNGRPHRREGVRPFHCLRVGLAPEAVLDWLVAKFVEAILPNKSGWSTSPYLILLDDAS